jgi:hypothetical protein
LVATVLQTPSAELAWARAATDGKAAFKVKEAPPTALPRAFRLKNVLFNVFASQQHPTLAFIERLEPCYLLFHLPPALLFECHLEICLEYFESGLQIRLKVVDRQVPGQVSLCEAWRVAFRRALEALDLTP